MPFAVQHARKKRKLTSNRLSVKRPCPCFVCKRGISYSSKVINRHLKAFGRYEAAASSPLRSSSSSDEFEAEQQHQKSIASASNQVYSRAEVTPSFDDDESASCSSIKSDEGLQNIGLPLLDHDQDLT